MTRSGLRRFVGAEEPVAAVPEPAPEERCELCGAQAGSQHGHVVDVPNHALLCACRPCYLLFAGPDPSDGRFRGVPERYAHDPAHPITRAEWETLGIPVGAVFLLRDKDGVTAFYPSPAGATECLLDLAAVADLTAGHPLLAQAQQDVEAILVHTEGRTSENGPVEAFLVPIDVCYELVGTVRTYWQGFDGGAEANTAIDAFFDRVRAAARPIVAG